MDMHRSKLHEMLARQTCDDVARAQFIVALKRHLRGMTRDHATMYERDVEPRFRAQHGRSPTTADEVGDAMACHASHRLWSTLTRGAQAMMWNAVEDTIARDMPRMLEAARRLRRSGQPAQSGHPLGSLTLDPGLEAPPDLLVANIHCQPGGYLRDSGEEDITAGALYESGGNLYSSGVGIGGRDSKAGAVIRHLAERFPDIRPRRILDLGCSAGGASVGYAATFPEAEVHAVDAGPAILRYAHARAEALGVAVHFHQMDVRRLGFPDGSFDLVVSHNLMHEISRDTLARMLAESHRLLRPGGIAVHQDVPIRGSRTLFERYLFAWETRHNNEPFWQVFAEAEVAQLLQAAGFAADSIAETELPKLDGPGAWYVATAVRSADP